jgi:hypothetical protein
MICEDGMIISGVKPPSVLPGHMDREAGILSFPLFSV